MNSPEVTRKEQFLSLNSFHKHYSLPNRVDCFKYPDRSIKNRKWKACYKEKIESYLFVCKNPFSKVEKIIWHTKQQGER